MRRHGPIAAVALAVAGLAVFGWISGWPKHRALHRRGVGVTGWVTAKDPVKKTRVEYAYEAGGREHAGEGRAGYGNPEFDELEPGARVAVFYLPEEPSVSVMGDPKEHVREQNKVLIWLLLLGIPAVWLAVRRELG